MENITCNSDIKKIKEFALSLGHSPENINFLSKKELCNLLDISTEGIANNVTINYKTNDDSIYYNVINLDENINHIDIISINHDYKKEYEFIKNYINFLDKNNIYDINLVYNENIKNILLENIDDLVIKKYLKNMIDYKNNNILSSYQYYLYNDIFIEKDKYDYYKYCILNNTTKKNYTALNSKLKNIQLNYETDNICDYLINNMKTFYYDNLIMYNTLPKKYKIERDNEKNIYHFLNDKVYKFTLNEFICSFIQNEEIIEDVKYCNELTNNITNTMINIITKKSFTNYKFILYQLLYNISNVEYNSINILSLIQYILNNSDSKIVIFSKTKYEIRYVLEIFIENNQVNINIKFFESNYKYFIISIVPLDYPVISEEVYIKNFIDIINYNNKSYFYENIIEKIINIQNDVNLQFYEKINKLHAINESTILYKLIKKKYYNILNINNGYNKKNKNIDLCVVSDYFYIKSDQFDIDLKTITEKLLVPFNTKPNILHEKITYSQNFIIKHQIIDYFYNGYISLNICFKNYPILTFRIPYESNLYTIIYIEYYNDIAINYDNNDLIYFNIEKTIIPSISEYLSYYSKNISININPAISLLKEYINYNENKNLKYYIYRGISSFLNDETLIEVKNDNLFFKKYFKNYVIYDNYSVSKLEKYIEKNIYTFIKSKKNLLSEWFNNLLGRNEIPEIKSIYDRKIILVNFPYDQFSYDHIDTDNYIVINENYIQKNTQWYLSYIDSLFKNDSIVYFNDTYCKKIYNLSYWLDNSCVFKKKDKFNLFSEYIKNYCELISSNFKIKDILIEHFNKYYDFLYHFDFIDNKIINKNYKYEIQFKEINKNPIIVYNNNVDFIDKLDYININKKYLKFIYEINIHTLTHENSLTDFYVYNFKYLYNFFKETSYYLEFYEYLLIENDFRIYLIILYSFIFIKNKYVNKEYLDENDFYIIKKLYDSYLDTYPKNNNFNDYVLYSNELANIKSYINNYLNSTYSDINLDIFLTKVSIPVSYNAKFKLSDAFNYISKNNIDLNNLKWVYEIENNENRNYKSDYFKSIINNICNIKSNKPIIQNVLMELVLNSRNAIKNENTIEKIDISYQDNVLIVKDYIGMSELNISHLIIPFINTADNLTNSYVKNTGIGFYICLNNETEFVTLQTCKNNFSLIMNIFPIIDDKTNEVIDVEYYLNFNSIKYIENSTTIIINSKKNIKKKLRPLIYKELSTLDIPIYINDDYRFINKINYNKVLVNFTLNKNPLANVYLSNNQSYIMIGGIPICTYKKLLFNILNLQTTNYYVDNLKNIQDFGIIIDIEPGYFNYTLNKNNIIIENEYKMNVLLNLLLRSYLYKELHKCSNNYSNFLNICDNFNIHNFNNDILNQFFMNIPCMLEIELSITLKDIIIDINKNYDDANKYIKNLNVEEIKYNEFINKFITNWYKKKYFNPVLYTNLNENENINNIIFQCYVNSFWKIGQRLENDNIIKSNQFKSKNTPKIFLRKYDQLNSSYKINSGYYDSKNNVIIINFNLFEKILEPLYDFIKNNKNKGSFIEELRKNYSNLFENTNIINPIAHQLTHAWQNHGDCNNHTEDIINIKNNVMICKFESLVRIIYKNIIDYGFFEELLNEIKKIF